MSLPITINNNLCLETISKDKWVDDSKCNTCHICTDLIKPGFMKSNKHHCRYCGFIICSKCSQNELNKKRICDECIQFEILKQIKKWIYQHNTKHAIHALILQHNKLLCPAVFIGNQIRFYQHVQYKNGKEIEISVSKILKISETFDFEYTQFRSVERSDLDTNGVRLYQIKLIAYYNYHQDIALTFIDIQKRDEWYDALKTYISTLMDNEWKRNWDRKREKDYFKTLSTFIGLTDCNKIKSTHDTLGHVHGSYILDCNWTKKAIWQFKINRINNDDDESVIIGIDNNLQEYFTYIPTPFNRRFSKINFKIFALCNNGKKWINDKYNVDGKRFKSGDVVTMIYKKPNLQFYSNEYCIDIDEVQYILSFWIRKQHISNYVIDLDYFIFKFYFYKSLLTQFHLNMEENKGIKYRLSVYLQFNAVITLDFFHQNKTKIFNQ